MEFGKAQGFPIVDVCRALEREHGNPRHGNPTDPLDDLVYIILSTRTREAVFSRTYSRLKARFPDWDQLGQNGRTCVEEILGRGGLGHLKTSQLLLITTELQRIFGRVTLDPLREMSDEHIEAFLTALPGVSAKVAKCVSMYALGRQVLPVDTHVHRLAKRLGLKVKKRPDTSQNLIERAVPPRWRHSFHVNAVAHGRRTCLPQRPKCGVCCISRWCKHSLNQGGSE